MLTISSAKRFPYCDGVPRRNFLKLGSLGFAGFMLADLLREEARAGSGLSNKAVINIHLSGGPSHQDMFDMKPETPVEIRGEFRPTATNVPGIRICELMPQLAKMADKYAVVRSLYGTCGHHTNFQTHTGFGPKDLQNLGGRPALGAVITRLQGDSSGAPPWISYNGGNPGYLGAAYRAYQPSGDNLRLSGDMSENRLKSRVNLLASLDSIRRDVDGSGQMDALDVFTQRAVGVVTSGKVADALDLDKEDPQVRDRYGAHGGGHFLRARRLVEAGVRVVTFNWGGWDTHGNNFGHLRGQLPKLDVLLSALIQDLHDRGLDKDVTVVAWGEFGRTPRINNKAGRDHWDPVGCALLAGGGMRTGQTIGASDRIAAYVEDRPVHYQEVFATLYHNLGIDPQTAQMTDPAGRPQYLLNHRTPIRELLQSV